MLRIIESESTLVNLAEDHGFINEEYYLYWRESFWGNPKQSQEISYHCGES